MAVQWSAPELATRYSSHVEELRDFFALQRLHFGAAEDIAPLMDRIGDSESFREDMTSMVRSIILHEGGTIPRANLLEIVAFAIGGRDMDQASLEVQEPLHQLLDFLMSVQRKPWNQPPGESRLQFAPSSAASRRAPGNDAGESSIPGPAVPQMSGEASPAAGTGKVIPITARPAMYSAGTVSVSPVSVSPVPLRADEAGSEAVQSATEAAEPAAVRSFARSDGVYSRLPRVEPEAAPVTSLALHEETAGAPSPTPEPIPPPPPPPMEGVPVVPAAASVAAAAPRPQAAKVRPPSALDPEPPSPSYPARRLPIALPSLHVPRAALPAWSWTKMSRSQIRTSALAAGGAALFIAVLVFLARSRSPAAVEIAEQPHASPAAASPAPRPQTAAAVPAKPSADGPALTHPRNRPHRNSGDDGLIAKPYSSSGLGQSAGQPPSAAAAAPIDRVSPTQSFAGDTPVRGGVLRPVALATTVEPSRPVDPDSTYVRAAPASEAIPLPRRPASVSSAVMTANLLSAPPPDYPLLAKLAHIQGRVVLRAEIGRNGRVDDVSVLSGHHLLRGAAVDALREWRFRPYLVDGHPAPVSTTITMQFPPHR